MTAADEGRQEPRTETVTRADRADVARWLLSEADQRVKFFPQRRDGLDALIRQIAAGLRSDQEPRTAGSLNADDLGREVTVGPTSDGWMGVLREIQHLQWTATTTTRVLLQGYTQHVHVPADAPVHVHDEEAGRG